MAETGNGSERFDLTGSGATPLGDEDPRKVGSIPLLGRLGSGGMGRVYLGVVDGRYAAIKQVLPAFAEDGDFLRHFGHELDNLARLPKDVSAELLASDREARPPWFATAYIPGMTLAQTLDLHGGPLSVPMLWLLLREAAAGLKAVHALDMVHRDLKPSNVMLTEQGVTLIDFGVARAADQSRLTRTGVMMGTPAYMSPEQANAVKNLSGATDVWALGAMLAYAAAGEPPFGDGSGVDLLYRIVHTEPDLTRIRELNSELAEVVAACLDKNPQARPSAERLYELGRQKCGAPKPGWPQEVMGVLAQRSAFAGTDAPTMALAEEAVPAAPAVSAAPAASPAPSGGTPIVLGGAPQAEQPRRRRRVLFTVVPILVAAGATATVALLPNFSPFSIANGPDPKGSGTTVQVTTGTSNSASPSASGSGTPSSHASASASASSGTSPTAKPSSTGGGSTGSASAGTTGGSTSGNTGTGGTNGATNGGGSGGNTGGTSGGSTGGSTRPPSGSAPGTVTHWSAYFQGFYVGYAQIPILVSWNHVSGATSYDIRYTNDGAGNRSDRTDRVIPVGNASSYTIDSQYSGDNICIWLRADNSYGDSPWSQSICTQTPE
ncbi:serine/threonine-protein kinase [Streptacidiphilus fuscans]|uniref:Protein kinase n=1 Tax=Streptacidiphilus fuscans TaxID=2789292 RepID=A0A931AXZ4_9ACTN|nr:serine/threonine-protein kinase [Streptacidiphilus fuscans]MBF9066791.1 protein kinase [Streptacidiphilus fuscans]